MASYSSLNSYRSAVSLISQSKLGDQIVSRFSKGVAKLKPLKPKYAFTWDVAVVYKYLEKLTPTDKLDLIELTEKTIIL